MNRQLTKEMLIEKLLKQNRFWSFDKQHFSETTDDIFIEKTLLYLDIEDIKLPEQYLKRLEKQRFKTVI